MPALTITPHDVETTLRTAGIDHPVTDRESTSNCTYLAAGPVGVTWYTRERQWGPEFVFELDTEDGSVSDIGETPAALLAALGRELVAA